MYGSTVDNITLTFSNATLLAMCYSWVVGRECLTGRCVLSRRFKKKRKGMDAGYRCNCTAVGR